MTSAPLAGKSILVTRSSEQQGGLTESLQRLGATVLAQPMLEITAPSSWDPLDQALVELPSYHWLILTSVNGVNALFKRLAFQGTDLPENLQLAVVGTKTQQALAAYDLQPTITPRQFDSEGLLIALQGVIRTGNRVLFPRVEQGGRDLIGQTLSAWGIRVTEVAAYDSKAPQQLRPEVAAAFDQQIIDVVTFASSKTVRHFAQLVQTVDLTKVSFAAIGPQTAQTCRECLGRVEVEANPYTLEQLVSALVAYYSSRH